MTDHRPRTPPSSPTRQSPSGQTRITEDQDRALLRRMAEGDESALAALYDEWGARVHTIALWILGDADEAEDVVEETFWQAWRTATRYDGHRAAGSTYLMMIARSRALDRLRGRRRRGEWTAAPSTMIALLAEAGRGETPSPDGQAEKTELYSALGSALGALPPEQREAVEMAFLGGFSHAEIAARTFQPLGTVKTRIRLAMQKLRQSLASLREPGP